MISTLFFERPWLLFFLLGALYALVVILWRWHRTAFWRRCAWGGALVVVGLMALNQAVVTPREQIVHLCRLLAALVEQGDVEGLANHLAEDFDAAGLTRTELIEQAGHTLKRYDVQHAKLRRFNVSVADPRHARATFDAICKVSGPDVLTDWLLTRWEITLRKHGERWQVEHAKVLPTPFSPIRRLRDCLR